MPIPFTLKTNLVPKGDQPRAIEELNAGIARGDEAQVLLGITGSGKTFTMAQVVAKLQVNATSCTATFSQLAAVQALRGDQSPVDAMVAEFRRRREVIVAGLRALPGFSCARPRGAFYVFPNIARTGFSSKALADKLLVTAALVRRAEAWRPWRSYAVQHLWSLA